MIGRQRFFLIPVFACAACQKAPALLSSSGQPGRDEAWLGNLFGIVAVIVLIAVTILLLAGIFRKRPAASSREITRRGNGIRWILAGGVVIPAIILVTLFFFVVTTLSTTAQPPRRNLAGTFDIVGHRWWWEVKRVDIAGTQQFVTANELHIPVGRPVRLHLSSADVIHSFWVPELAGKTDVIPGQVNDAWLMAEKPGVYFARCAEYCGMQHAHMALRVVAESDSEYTAWLSAQKDDAAIPMSDEETHGREVFLGSACASCHQIRGTAAGALVGPDLTHIGSRRTVGAGALPNTEGNLAGWIANSQTIKPGNAMPAMYLPARDLHDVVEYLESLK
jgi:cytochrome c oxidase subunit 2